MAGKRTEKENLMEREGGERERRKERKKERLFLPFLSFPIVWWKV